MQKIELKTLSSNKSGLLKKRLDKPHILRPKLVVPTLGELHSYSADKFSPRDLFIRPLWYEINRKLCNCRSLSWNQAPIDSKR